MPDRFPLWHADEVNGRPCANSGVACEFPQRFPALYRAFGNFRNSQ